MPPYDVLDEILRLYVEENLSARDIVARGFDEKTVRWVQRRVDLNEYKREQAAPGIKVTSRAFGVGRRMPIAQQYIDLDSLPQDMREPEVEVHRVGIEPTTQ